MKMKLYIYFPILVFIALLGVSCDKVGNHDKAIKEALKLNPIASSIISKYGGQAMIVHYDIDHNEKLKRKWVQVFFLKDKKFEVNYVSNVILDKKGGMVLSFTEDKELIVKEIKNIKGKETTYGDRQDRYFGKDVAKVLKSNFSEYIGK